MSDLDDFKTGINLTEYAAAHGYELDSKESSRNSVVMRKPDGDKIIIARGHDKHWIYFSVRNDRDNGSIIDFLINRKGYSFADIRAALRPWIGRGPEPRRPPVKSYVPRIEPISRDKAKVLAALARMEPAPLHPYLISRGLPAAVLEDPRFDGRIYIDDHKNAVFPHWNLSGRCGYEIKNRGFTGFARGGEKGLWITPPDPDARTLVIAETAIDALSYAALFPDATARYASIGGGMNPEQPALVCAALERMQEGAALVAATDADADGRRIAVRFEETAQEAGRAFRRHEPPQEGSDWNDWLRPQGKPLSLFLAL